MKRLRKAAGRAVERAKKALPNHAGWCWACDYGRHSLGDDNTCPCCRNGHAPGK